MGRWTRMVMMALVIFLGLAGSASATTYYIAANGSDSNSGTSKTSPWLHAPGMSTCTATCASTTVKAGDSIIFRGGDTWHFGNSSLSPFAGYKNHAWSFSASGSAANCQLNPAAGAIITTTCIYIGVDQGWYSGSSWARPKFNMDNPLTTSSPSSCAYEDSSDNLLSFSGQYLIVDNLEVLGYCWNTTSPYNEVVSIGANDEMKGSYWHGWTMGATATGCGSCDSDEYWAISAPNAIGVWSRIDHDVFDGSDSTYGNMSVGSGHATGGIFLAGGEIDHNVLNHCSNGVKYTRAYVFHDNLIENMSEPPVGGTHGNIDELPGTAVDWTVDAYYYNNVIRQTNEGETIDMYPGAGLLGKAAYIFNNVMTGPNANPTNCYMIEGDGVPGPGPTYFFNNTSDAPCGIRSLRGSSTGIFQNNDFIGYSPSGSVGNFSQMAANTDNGNEIWQSESTANGQGYLNSNNYAPSSSGGATVGAGSNLSSICSSMDNAEAAQACRYGIGGVTYDAVNHVAVDDPLVPRGSAWDAGAYQFSAGAVSTQPNPPGGLTAVVQ
ncbi:MAG: hypothetical protein ACRD4R_12575 [Candidatus Acidiferrales bacterium]